MLQKVKLLKHHNGRLKGAVVEVDDKRAAKMIETGIAKRPRPSARKPKPE